MAEGSASREAAPAIEGVGISRSFGGVRALNEASFSARMGEIHGLVGENGAGKSTLIKILSGVLAPDSGAIRVKGHETALGSPQDAQVLGVGTVFQELTLLPFMTVAENLLLRREPRGFAGLIRRREMATQAEKALSGLGIEHIDPLELVENLSLAQQQIIEIARVVTQEPDILFMDEPTSALAGREVEWLFGLLKRLREKGKCIVFTSHRWKEMDIADRITIFRDGTHVGTREQIDEAEAVTLMTGRTVDTMYPKLEPLGDEEPVMEVRGLGGSGLNDVSFTLNRGEILGVGGLDGQGQRELFLALFGAPGASEGESLVGGEAEKIRRPSDAIRAGMGIALVPEDRKSEGLLLSMSVRDNLTLPILKKVSTGGVINAGRERGLVRQMFERLQIRARGTDQTVSTLSGGNQQKALIGRWLLADTRILLFYDVTRGVDVATKHDVYELMLRLVDEGRSILFYSSDTDEVANLSHRVLVMREGSLAAELRGPGVDPEALVAAALRDNARA